MSKAKEMPDVEACALSLPTRAFTYRFLLAFCLFLMILFSGAAGISRTGNFILTLIIYVFCADVFHRCGLKDLLRNNFSFAVLVSSSLTCALVYTLAYTFFAHPFFGTAPGLSGEIALLTLLALWIQRRLVQEREKTGVFIRKLDDFLPKSARLMNGQKQMKVFAYELHPGDIILVRSGERIPCEGEIVKGQSEIDESLITGNMLPAAKSKGSKVYAGTLNKAEDIFIKVTEVLDRSTIKHVIDTIKTSEVTRSGRGSKLDRQSLYLLPFMLIMALGVYAYILYTAEYSRALHFLGVFLLIMGLACPAGFIFAPVFSKTFCKLGARRKDITLQNLFALDVLEQADSIFFDKTGTLTYGELRISGVYADTAAQRKQLLEYLYAAEQSLDGAFAEAVQMYAVEKGVKLRKLMTFDFLPGMGVSAVLRTKDKILAGRERWLRENGVEITGELATGQSVICVAKNGNFVGYVTLSDVLRPGAHELVGLLKSMGKEVILISGDNESSVLEMAKGAGIDQLNFNVLPQTKAEIIANQRALGKKVVMVGDGFNDITALLRANAGVVFATGKNVYNNWVDVIIHRKDLFSIADLFTINKRLKKNISTGVILAVAANLALLGWLIFGVKDFVAWYFVLLCQLGGVALVFLNAVRLLKIK